MRTSTFGIALIIVGIMIFAYTGINFIGTKKVLEIGPVNIDREASQLVQWSPVVGVVLFLGGIVLLVRGRKRLG